MTVDGAPGHGAPAGGPGFERVRSEFELPHGVAYLNTAYMGPVPLHAVADGWSGLGAPVASSATPVRDPPPGQGVRPNTSASAARNRSMSSTVL